MHLETNDILRFNRFSIDDDFGTLYIFSDSKYDAPWFCSDLKDLEFIINNKHIHPKYSMFYNRPSKEKIDFSLYKISEFSNE
jgi:hypothetical protein